jgi:hypothetical protein
LDDEGSEGIPAATKFVVPNKKSLWLLDELDEINAIDGIWKKNY